MRTVGPIAEVERDRLTQHELAQDTGSKFVDNGGRTSTQRDAERDDLVDPQLVEHRQDVGGHARVRQASGLRRHIGCAVAAQVDADGPEVVT